eukprot:4954438-Lingulodinium_polyedra.AAC.1
MAPLAHAASEGLARDAVPQLHAGPLAPAGAEGAHVEVHAGSVRALGQPAAVSLRPEEGSLRVLLAPGQAHVVQLPCDSCREVRKVVAQPQLAQVLGGQHRGPVQAWQEAAR